MPEQATQPTTATAIDWEKQAKDHQSAYTKGQQELAEFHRRMEQGELVVKSEYDQSMRQWANDDTENALGFLGIREKIQDMNAIGSNAGQGPVAPYGEFDDSIFDTTSEAHKKFVEENGQVGYRQAALSRMAPELLRLTGMDTQLAELREQNQTMAEQMAELREQSEQAYRYATSSYDQTSLLKDPRLQKVRDTIERLQKDRTEWFNIVQKVEEADALRAELKALKTTVATTAPTAPASVESQRPISAPDPSPEQLAVAIQYANAVPQGTAGNPASGPSQYADPFDYAVDKALGKVA